MERLSISDLALEERLSIVADICDDLRLGGDALGRINRELLHRGEETKSAENQQTLELLSRIRDLFASESSIPSFDAGKRPN